MSILLDLDNSKEYKTFYISFFWQDIPKKHCNVTSLKLRTNEVILGEGNGTPLQYSCLENPRDRGACWAAVYGVTQSRTRLTQLSSSSRSDTYYINVFNLQATDSVL